MAVKADTADPDIITSAGEALSIVAKAGGLVVVTTLIAYGMGWGAASHYYAHFGASWLGSEVSTLEMLSFVSFWGLCLLFVCLNQVASLARGSTDHNKLRRTSIRYLIIGIALTVTGLGIKLYWQHLEHSQLVSSFFYLSAISWAVAIASDLSFLIEDFRQCGLKLDGNHLMIIAGIAIAGMYQSPIMLGSAAAERDRSPESTTLPKVALATAENWWLLRVSGDNLFLVDLSSKDDYLPIRIVKATDEVRIQREIKRLETSKP